MKKNFLSIKWQITAVIIVLILLTVFLMSLAMLNFQKKSLLNEMELRGEALTLTLANSIADFLFVHQDIETAKILKEMLSNKGVIYSFVTDEKGRIIVHNDMLQINKISFADWKFIGYTPNKNKIYINNNNLKIINFSRSVIAKGKIKLGNAHLGLSYNIIEETLKYAYLRIVLLTIAIVILGIVVAFFWGDLLARPILELAKGAEIVGKGNLDFKILLKEKNELGILAETFNSMTAGLKEAQKAIIERSILMKELEIAREIQLSIIPQKIPQISGYKIATYYKAAEIVGGDYFDIIELDNSNYGFVIADVSGKGIPAALVMAMASSILHSQAVLTKNPKECIVRFNNELIKIIKRGMHITIFYGILNTEKSYIDFISAGHNETLIYRQRTRKIDIITLSGFPAGIVSVSQKHFINQITEEKINLNKGDKVLIYTDGITESVNMQGQQLGLDKFIEIIEKYANNAVEYLKDNIINEINNFTGGAEQSDDIAFIIIEKIN